MGLPTGDDYVDELVRSLAGPRGGAGRDALKDGDARTSREGDGFDFDAFDFDAFARRERRREREYHAAWDAICTSLREGKGLTGFGSGFSKAIAAANGAHFGKIGCVAAYAEYGPGQKAMVVFTEQAAAGRITA